MRRLGITALAVFVLDQVTKVLVVHVMNLKVLGTIEVLPGILTFRMAWNRGINFGLLAGDTDLARWTLIAVAVAISGWVIWWLGREGGGWPAMASGGLLVGGAIGNVIDRVIYGAVADFLNVTCCGIENPWSFNVADISIFAGAFGLILFTGGDKPRDEPRKPG